MLRFAEGLEILVSLEAIDMRCSIDGLLYRISKELEVSPQSKTLFLFCNKSRDKVKGLLWDKNGFVLVYKRLEKGRFKFPRAPKEAHQTISQAQLLGLLAGFEFLRMKDYPELKFDYYG